MRKKWIGAVAFALIGALLPIDDASAAGPRPAFHAPWPCGVTWNYFHHSAEVSNAIDYNGPGINGTPALAGAAAGTVVSAGWNSGYGNQVVVDHGGGWRSRVAHLSAITVSVGQGVTAATQLGRIGSTGNSTGPHLHYEQIADGGRVPIVIDGVAMNYDGRTRQHTSGNCGGGGPAPDRVNQVNGDGYADVVGVDANGELFGYHNASLVSGDGQPYTSETWRLRGSDWSGARHMATGDINRDGYADLVAAMSDGSLVIYNNGSLVHEGDLPFLGETWRFRGSWQNIKQLAVADVTDDQYADLIVVDGDGTLVVYGNGSLVNPGGAPFSGETYRFGNWGQVRHLAATDVNHDGAADIVAVDANGQLFGYHNGRRVNSGGVPFAAETWRIDGNWTGVRQFTAGDVNKDGFGDLVAVEADGSLSIYGNGSLVNPNGIPYAGRTWHIRGSWNNVRTIA